MRKDRSTDGRPILRFASGLAIRLGNLRAAAGLVALVAAIAVLSAGFGTTRAGMLDLLREIIGADLTDAQSYALWTVRLPRIALGFMTGWAVALSGAMLQSIARNPLADPGLLGVSQGSMTTIMLLLVLVPAAPKALVAGMAVGGGLSVALLLIWLVGGERSSGLALLLMGIAVETVLSSVGAMLLLYTPPEISLSLADWMAGSLFAADWPTVAAFAPLFALSMAGAFLVGARLSVYELGGEMAVSLGESVRWSRPAILILAVVLSASAVTAVGPLIFLGVLAPHIAGFLSPATARARLYLSGLTGGALVIAADAISRGGATGIPLPVGLALTLIGVPLFILTLRLQALRRRG
ncbi:Iron ABC transporter permease [uncultured Pleomorphomonas sp.]|uniref:Iron ABC transporter permease n=1 Tax=uncultured Pleomorphomonas sp. TaxID=442121 RepID=A0A212LLQ5_9HYPH|nr:iron ABC transporter permease [uncultured Pleomorphomonas sp.]SCM78470.1 Iron ABC transporter permease [uncultured Pleomorphomonas sp.]